MVQQAPNPPASSIATLATSTPPDTVEATSELWKVVRDQQGKDDAVARILVAVTRLAREASKQQLSEVLGASSEYGVLLRLLNQPDALAYLSERDPLAPARLRGLEVRQRLLEAEGGVLTAGEVGSTLGITRQAVDNRRKRKTLIAVQLGKRGYRYPAWQFSGGQVLPGLDRILRVLGDLTPWMQMAFFLNDNAWLKNRRPLDLLRLGEIEPVLMAAQQYGEQSAA